MTQTPPRVALLTGGTGGAKLAAGLAATLGPENLDAIVNTGDDIEIYGAYVSPDPDLVSFWLANTIDERGWGLKDDSFKVMDGLRQLGVDVWFNLGDRDLAWCMERSRMLEEGLSPTEALARLNDAIHQKTRVLPASDTPVRTFVRTPRHDWLAFQEFMIRAKAEGPVTGVEYRHAQDAHPTEQVLEAIAMADAIVIGPSNPLVSIGPILAIPGIREALQKATAPVVAVSPIVAGAVIKGPTAAFMQYAQAPLDATGIAQLYDGVLDGLVTDEALDPGNIEILKTNTRMDDAHSRHRLASATVEFALEL
ncbi:MAG TPA: 2-phospho-L-lactate transferase [Solirubrobacteraceae bacterium]|jgi:LPPG:FO 2-phospho-L-lactate transferase